MAFWFHVPASHLKKKSSWSKKKKKERKRAILTPFSCGIWNSSISVAVGMQLYTLDSIQNYQ